MFNPYKRTNNILSLFSLRYSDAEQKIQKVLFHSIKVRLIFRNFVERARKFSTFKKVSQDEDILLGLRAFVLFTAMLLNVSNSQILLSIESPRESLHFSLRIEIYVASDIQTDTEEDGLINYLRS